MPPKSVSKKSSASTSKCRRSARLAYRIKSMKKGQSASSKGQPSTKKRGKLPYRKKSVAKRQPASSKEEQSSSTKEEQSSTKEEQSSSTKESGKPSYSKKTVTKRQPASSNEGQSTSTKKSTVKRRRVMEMDEINERVSQMGLQEKEDFSTAIKNISEELSPNLIISEDAIVDMNLYLNHVFEKVARTSAIFLMERSEVSMTEKDIETTVLHVVGGELAKFCIAEGRRAVKKWNAEK